MRKITELRELLAQATPGEWHSLKGFCEVCTEAETDDTVCDTRKQADARLIAAMHNAMPDLLDAAETLLALEWARGLYGSSARCGCEKDACPIRTYYCEDPHEYGVTPCENPWDYRDLCIAAYQERGNK